MNQKELDKIIANHQHWLNEDIKSWKKMKADLSGADLKTLSLQWADLYKVNLSGADLFGADLRDANLSGANLSGANLSGADLSGADLSGANLCGANLCGADLEFADIYTAYFDKKDEIRKGIVLKKAIKGYKKTSEGLVITAIIPAGAVVYSINGKKCRTNMATITDTAGKLLLHSQYYANFTYYVGKKIIITDFDIRYNVECGAGFHFFRTRKEAENY